jgi:hypothetical protein
MALLTAILGWLLKLLTKPPTTVKVANDHARASADIERATTAKTHEDIAHATAETARSVDDVRRAGSVSDAARIVQSAIDRANSDN